MEAAKEAAMRKEASTKKEATREEVLQVLAIRASRLVELESTEATARAGARKIKVRG